MSRKKYPQSVDMFEVKNKTGLSEEEQAAIVELYGYSLPNRPAWEQFFTPEDKWQAKWGIKSEVMRSLLNKGLIERETVGNFEWKVRLTAKAFRNVDSKKIQKLKLANSD